MTDLNSSCECLSVIMLRWVSHTSHDLLVAANIRVVDPAREFGSSGGLSSVAWKERVEGWKMKQEEKCHPDEHGSSYF